ncbi:MAG: hypothetical protein A2Z27_03415 [candidate division Zixibacteria bacterium RBG_16_50_21]|nr:MAG: hypothetical protein A2Z27_03415 [candidate division Zixibacteria bacterium RBG_16_50_21]
MKRLFTFLALAAPFLFLTCSADKNLSQRYQMEKAFGLGEQFRENLYINLQAAAPDDYQKAIAYYQAVKDQSPFRVNLSTLTNRNEQGEPFPKTKAETDSLNEEEKQMLNFTKLAYIRISELLINQKEFDQALAEANGYLSIFTLNDLNRQMMRVRKGQIYDAKEMPDSAVVEFELALQEYAAKNDRQNPVQEIMGLPFYVITLQMRSGDFSQQLVQNAATYFKSLIDSPASDPLSQLATQYLADLFLRNNQFEQAVSTLGTLVDSTGKVFPEPLLAIADLYLVRKGDFAKSRETFNRFVDLYPAHELTPFATYGVGRTYYQQKQYQKALEVFDKVKADYALNPRVVPATQFQIGLTYYQMGNWERAKTELDWLILNYPDSPEGMKAVPFIADFYRGQNNAQLAKSYFEKAVKQYGQIIQKDPKSSAAYAATQLMTEVYLTQGLWQEAANTLEDHLQANPTSPANAEVLILLGQLYEEKLKNKDKANRTYATFLMKFPQDPRAKEALERAKKLSLEMQEEGGQKLPGE